MQSRFCCFYTFLYNWRLISSLVLTLYDQREQTWFNQTLLLSIQFHAMKTWIKMNHNLISLGWNFDIGVFFVCTPHIKNFIGLLSNKRGSQVLVHQKMEGICCKWGKVTVNHFLEEINKSHSFDKWVWPLIDMIFCQNPSMSFKSFENTTLVNTWIYIRLKSLKIFWFGI